MATHRTVGFWLMRLSTPMGDHLDRAVRRLARVTAARTTSTVDFNNAIRDAYRIGVTQDRIAEVVGLTQARVSQIVNEKP